METSSPSPSPEPGPGGSGAGRTKPHAKVAMARALSPEALSLVESDDVSSYNSDSKQVLAQTWGPLAEMSPGASLDALPEALAPGPGADRLRVSASRTRFQELIGLVVGEYELALTSHNSSNSSSNLAFAAAAAAAPTAAPPCTPSGTVASPPGSPSGLGVGGGVEVPFFRSMSSEEAATVAQAQAIQAQAIQAQAIQAQAIQAQVHAEVQAQVQAQVVALAPRVTFQTSSSMPLGGRGSIDSSPGGSVMHSHSIAGGAISRWELLVRQVTSSDTWVLRRCWDQSDKAAAEPAPEKTRRQFLRAFSLTSDLTGASADPDFALGIWKQRNWTGRRGSMFAARQWRKGGNEYFDRTCILHPDASLRAYWACFGVFFLFVDMVFLTMSVYDLERPTWTTVVDIIYWALDVVVCFRTAVFLHGTVTFSRTAIAKQYLRSWFGFDLLLLIYQCILMSWPDFQNFKYLRLFRFLRMARLAKLDLMYGQFLKLSQSLHATMMVKMCLLFFCLMLWVHVSACSWYWIGTTMSESHSNWLIKLIENGQEVDKFPQSYFVSLHWATSQLQGGIDVVAVSPIERLFVVIHTMLSVVASALLIGKLMTVLQELEHMKSERKGIMESAFVFMRQHRIPTDLCIAVQRQLKRRAAQQSSYQRVGSEERLFANLPRRLRRALLEESRWLALGRVFIFEAMHACNIKFANKICCDIMQSEIYMPDDAIFHHGDVAKNIFYVDNGIGRYQPKNSAHDALTSDNVFMSGGGRYSAEMKMVSKVVEVGALLCEALMWVRWQHQGDFDVGPIHQVILLRLSCESFLEQVTKFGDVSQAFSPHAARVAEHLNSGAKLDDLWCSELSMKRNTERPSSRSYNRSGTQESLHEVAVTPSSLQLAANTKLNQHADPSGKLPGPHVQTWTVGGQPLPILTSKV